MSGAPRHPQVHLLAPSDQAELAADALWEAGANGIEERDATTIERADTPDAVCLVAAFATEEDAQRAARALGERWPCKMHVLEGDAWLDAWKAHFKQQRIGQRLVVTPSWLEPDVRPDDALLVLDPDRAFGTGTHESTRLALHAIEAHVRPGQRVLDVGCGSGILSVASLLLGAEHALAVDVDVDATHVTRENAERNAVIDRIDTATTPIENVRGQYDLVLANIEAHTLSAMAEALVARLAPGGLLVLSGVLRGQEDDLRARFADLTLLDLPQEGDWVALLLRRQA
jgi:ribosomal protein L11 methyltransferase